MEDLALRARARAVMEAHWQPEGFTVPHASVYPYRWLWDSCFHVVVWAELGELERAAAELAHVFCGQDADGLVPHIAYGGVGTHDAFWGRTGYSTISQPPMYGHAVAELARRGGDVNDETVERAQSGVRYFLRHRRHRSGLIAARHPWETGCDDSARFDHWGASDPARWFQMKGDLVAGLPDNGFDCAPVSLSALVAWNARELGIDDDGVAEAVAARWDAGRRTWADAGAGASSSGRARALEAMLGLLVDPRAEARAELADPGAYAAPFGPRGMHRDEPAYDPRRYWRGPVWPQLSYLLWCAGSAAVATPTVEGARSSGLAEYWDPEDGTGLGAIPQSWAALALVLSAAATTGGPGE
ncbi:MAG: MGH1-like glycoside hydrolase domain-containing protein [Acidimicrobiia bacterium]